MSKSPISELKSVSKGTLVECSSKNGLLLIPALINGQRTELLLDTGAQGGVVLDWSYADRVGLTISERHKKSVHFDTGKTTDGGKAKLSEFEVLGRTARSLTVSVEDLLTPSDPLRGEIAGYLGPKFFSNALLFVDPSERTVGLFDAFDGWGSWRSKGILLRLLPQAKELLPFTNDLVDVITPEQEPLTALLDTGSQVTIVAMNYLRRKKKHAVMRWLLDRAYKRGKTVKWAFALPGDAGFKTRVHLAELSPIYTAGTGVPDVGAILGMDFFRHWIALFNFGGHEVLLLRSENHAARGCL